MTRMYVVGRPAPQGSKRHVGNGRMVEMSKHVEPWRLAVRDEARVYFPEPLTGPVSVMIRFYLKAPRVIPAEREGRPITTPDLDKLVRSTFDGLTGVAFVDDAQVVEVIASKHYCEPGDSGAEVSVVRMSDAA
jgi:crossover junction endodeoxyribonuclease RusA